ncbi:hypothetical protein [Endothiovibrio diazotrophicus]
MDIKKPRTVEQYVDLIDQAIFEVEELRLAMEYDMEGMGGADSFLAELEEQIRGIKRQMAEGTYQWASGDLPFMDIVNHASDRALPFKHLLRLINFTHVTGLETSPEDD